MDDIKSLILDKARERMDRFGYKKTTMDEISKDCKISKKTIYEQFADKEAMFKTLLLRECHQTIKILFQQMGDVPDPLERLIRLVRLAVRHMNQDQFITRILRDDAELFLACFNKDYFELVDEEIIAVIVQIIREGKKLGRFRAVDEKTAAYAVFKLFQAFSYRRTGFMSKLQNEQEYTDVLIDFLVNALAAKPYNELGEGL